MTGLLESPLPALLGGGLLTAILIGGWIQTARLWPLYASVGVIAVTVLLVLLEHHVETDREKIASTLPAAPSKCPIDDLVELILILLLLVSFIIAFSSISSPI